MFHQDCTWTLEEKKKELYRIISNPITKEVFCYMKDHERFSLEGLLYQSVYISGNLKLLRVYISVLSLLRRIKMSFVSVIMPVYNEVCVEKVIEFY